MQKPAVTVMVKAARLAGNVLLRNINKLEALNVVQKGPWSSGRGRQPPCCRGAGYRPGRIGGGWRRETGT